MENFQNATEVDPNYPSPYFGMEKSYQLSGNLDEAIVCWTKAIEIQPNFDQAIYYLGLAYLDKGEKSRALTYFNTLKENSFRSYPEAQKQKIEALIEECKK